MALSLHTDFTDLSTFTPGPHNVPALGQLLDQVVGWSTALEAARPDYGVGSGGMVVHDEGS